MNISVFLPVMVTLANATSTLTENVSEKSFHSNSKSSSHLVDLSDYGRVLGSGPGAILSLSPLSCPPSTVLSNKGKMARNL